MEAESIRLLPWSPQQLLALIEGNEPFQRCFGLPAAEGLRDLIEPAEVSPAELAQLHACKATNPWVYGFAVVHRRSDSVIGVAGFKGPPDEQGVVEITHAILPRYQRRGGVGQTIAALVAFAFDRILVRRVRAHTAPTPSPLTRVLAKCRFKRNGEVEDPEDGLLWRWERNKDPA